MLYLRTEDQERLQHMAFRVATTHAQQLGNGNYLAAFEEALPKALKKLEETFYGEEEKNGS